jgi:hypothetical protein
VVVRGSHCRSGHTASRVRAQSARRRRANASAEQRQSATTRLAPKGPVTPALSRADTLRVEKLRVVSEMPVPAGSPWDEWDRLTRFLESARIAFARERDYWTSTRIEGAAHGRISAPEGHYKVTPRRHIDAINDAETLHGFVLVHSYALAESAAAQKLEDPRSFGGIEDWGARLLDANGRDWSDVKDGLAGAVEVAVSRNAFAHGSRTIDATARTRLLRAGAGTRPPGSRVTLTHAELWEFRERLKSLLNAGGIGH